MRKPKTQSMLGSKHKFLTSLLAIILMQFLVSSCTARRLIYQHLDWVILHQFDRYLDLNHEQKHALKAPVKQLIHWYKSEKLSELVSLLQSLERAAEAREISSEQLDGYLSTLDRHRRDLIGQLTPALVPLAISLDTKQLAHFQKKMLARDKKRMKLLGLDSEDFQEEIEDHLKDLGKSFRDLLGPLRKDQELLLANSLQLTQARLQEQQDQRQRFRVYWDQLLTQKDPKAIQAGFAAMISQERPDLNAEDQRILAEQRDSWRKFWQLLLPSLDTKQWQHLQKFAAQMAKELSEQQLAKS